MKERELFIAALQKEDPAQRAAFLDLVCAGEPGLRQRIERLLDAYGGAGSFLESPDHLKPGCLDQLCAERPGTVVGSYRLLQQIGEGGMGTVYMAEQQEPMRRTVAVKVIRPGMDSTQVIARFEAERQALAMMDHPNIARVFDAGATDSGRPYFVMELVKGVPITEFCDANQLNTEKRLELFIQVCQAVQHAHQKGIIHRDLKPCNVLVTMHDDKPVPKVIDFGIAKATQARLTERTLFTEFRQFVGTPQYTSPEQAQMSGLDVDTRSDIYSLGVLLYELLTGTTPLDPKELRSAGFDQMERMIRETEPPRPSTRLSTLGQALVTIAARRRIDPKRLPQVVRGELDWIAMKCLEKDRTRRYETANGLAMDVRRYLDGEVVLARPASAGYRFRKFARRHRAALATASAVALGVLLAVVALTTSTILIGRALKSETIARGELGQTLQREWRDANYHRIFLAHRELAADNFDNALRLLNQCPQELRGWEWHYLWRLCRVEPMRFGGMVEVHSVAFGPDGKRIATACAHGMVKVLDAVTGEVLQAFPGQGGHAFSIAFSPDGQHIASAGTDRKIRLWNLEKGQQVFELPGDLGEYTGMAYAIAFSPDGRHLVAGDDEGFVTIWDTSDGRQVHRLSEKHEGTAASVAYSSDGRLLATGSWAGVVRLFDAATGQLLRWIDAHRMRISGVAFSRDGKQLATISFDRLVKVWDLASDKPGRTLGAHAGIVTGLAFSPDGQRLFSSGGEDKVIKVFDLQAGREVLSLRDPSRVCHGLGLSPDGLRLASAGADGAVTIWDARPLEGDARQEFLSCDHESEVWSVAYSQDGRLLATTSWLEPRVWLWDGQSGTPLRPCGFPPEVLLVLSARFSPDGRYLAASAITRNRAAALVMFDVEGGRRIHYVPEGASPPFFVTYDPTGRFLIREGPDHTLQVREATTGQAVGAVGRHDQQIWAAVFSPDGTRLATASNDSTVRVWAWDPATLGQEREPEYTLHVPVGGYSSRLAFSPSGRLLATAGEQSAVWIWDIDSGSRLHAVPGHTGDVFALAFSPDGRWLATAGNDTTVRLWDTASWQLRRTLRGHRSTVMSLAFSPDSRHLASGSRDRTMKVWEIHPAVAGIQDQRIRSEQNSGR